MLLKATKFPRPQPRPLRKLGDSSQTDSTMVRNPSYILIIWTTYLINQKAINHDATSRQSSPQANVIPVPNSPVNLPHTSPTFPDTTDDTPKDGGTGEEHVPKDVLDVTTADGILEDVPIEGDAEPDPDERIERAGRPGRKWKVHDVGNLSQCLCRSTVTLALMASGEVTGIRCQKPGCDTEWVRNSAQLEPITYLLASQYHLASIGWEIAPKNWICEPCLSSGTPHGEKWRG